MAPPTGTGPTKLLELGADLISVALECLDRTNGDESGEDNPRPRRNQGDGGPCSFAADTGVLMADGTIAPKSDVAVGEWVLAVDPETGERSVRHVTATWVHHDQLVDLEIGGAVVTTTEDHPFWNVSDREWQRADELGSGELVRTADGDRVTVDGIDWATQTGGVAHNLTVADLHTYFVVVGDSEVLIHIKCDPNLKDGWRGTNMSAEQSMNYHWEKHGKPRGVSREQYLEDSAAWARTVDPMMGTPTKLQDGSTDYVIRVKILQEALSTAMGTSFRSGTSDELARPSHS